MPNETELERKNMKMDIDKEIITQAAQDLVFALSYLNCKGSGMRGSLSGGKFEPWQNTFMDTLSKLGVEVDRDAYWESKDKKAKK